LAFACVRVRTHARVPAVCAGRHLFGSLSTKIGRQRPLCARVASERPDSRLPSECASFDGYFCAHGWFIPVCELCQREAAGARLVRVVKLACMRLQELRGGMRRIGETCTAAQTRIRCKDIATEEYDQNGGRIQRRRRVPVGMASFASQRPIARIAASGSAKFRLPTIAVSRTDGSKRKVVGRVERCNARTQRSTFTTSIRARNTTRLKRLRLGVVPPPQAAPESGDFGARRL
jgi:hypothetical protein